MTVECAKLKLQVQALRRTTQFLECTLHRKLGTDCANTAYGARRRRLAIRGHTTVSNPPVQSQWELGRKGIRIWPKKKYEFGFQQITSPLFLRNSSAYPYFLTQSRRVFRVL